MNFPASVKSDFGLRFMSQFLVLVSVLISLQTTSSSLVFGFRKEREMSTLICYAVFFKFKFYLKFKLQYIKNREKQRTLTDKKQQKLEFLYIFELLILKH